MQEHSSRLARLKLYLAFLGLAFISALVSVPILTASVRAQGAFGIISGPSADSITEDSAVIRWTTNEPSSTRVYLGKTTSLEMGLKRKIIPIEETEVEEINHALQLGFGMLESGTTYWYKVESVTADARRAGSELKSFTTKSSACASDDWACGEWETCSADGRQSRECAVKNDCPDVQTPSPETARTCVPAAPDEEDEPSCTEDKWECSDWSECHMGPKMTGEESRRCTKTFDCPGVDAPPKPAETRWCQLKERSVIETTTDSSEPESEKKEEEPPADVPKDEDADEPDSGPRTDDVPVEEAEIRSAVDDFEKNTENVSGGFGLIGADADDIGADLSLAADQTCENGGLSDEECGTLLKNGLGFEDCAAEGFMTKASCDKFLTERNGGTFPGCEGRTGEQCEAIKDLTTLEYLDDDVKKKADQVLQDMIDKGVVVPIEGVTSISEDASKDAGWWKSSPGDGAETSAGVIVIDSDGDKLPDDFEVGLGTDPSDTDSDDDGLDDLAELRAGSDPLNPDKKAKLSAPLDSTALTVVNRAPLEQPRGSGETDEALVVALDSVNDGNNENWDFGGQDTIKLSGSCVPNSTCLIYVYSYIPMVLTVTSDENGRWTYDIAKNVADGSHTAYVAVTDENGKITKKSSPFSFFVKEAKAANEDAFLTPVADLTAPEQTFQRWYIYGTLALVAFAGLLVWGASRTRGKVS